MTNVEIILGLFFLVIIGSSLHPALRVVLATIVAVLLLLSLSCFVLMMGCADEHSPRLCPRQLQPTRLERAA